MTKMLLTRKPALVALAIASQLAREAETRATPRVTLPRLACLEG